jgi:putative membrane protein
MNKSLIFVSSVALLAGCARNHQEGMGSPRSEQGVVTGTRIETDVSTKPDAAFAKEAAQSGAAEVRMAQLIVQNAESQALKDFGKRLLEDHTKASQKLSQIASTKGLTAPSQPNEAQQKMLDHLGSLKGAEFDRVAQKHAIEEHEKAIKLFENAAATCQDPELKSFAQTTLPTLQEHLKLAKGLERGETSNTDQPIQEQKDQPIPEQREQPIPEQK